MVEAIHAGLVVDAVYATEGIELPPAIGDDLVRRVQTGVLDRVLDATTPQGVAAVAQLPGTSITDALATAGPVLVLVEIGDPGNVGTIIRSAEAAGVGGVVITAGSADPFGPKAVRASAGSVFRVPVSTDHDPASVSGSCREQGRTMFGSVMDGGISHLDVDLGGRVALFLGNEAHGLSDDVLAELGGRVSVEMAGPTESLNVAMCATVLVFEAFRQRRTGRS